MWALLVVAAALLSVAHADKITSLPGYNGPELSQYSGYIGVGGSRKLFYWFIEAQENPQTAPLVFWYQGGPGCSGLAGLLTENGPLVANDAGGLDYNPISWTNKHSVVFLEQPAFVGYSYSDDPLDHASSDEKSGADNLAFVEGWLAEFPQYKGRPTWFSGESYGGVYVPWLTSLVFRNPQSQIFKQLVGITVGNGVMNCGSSTTANQMGLFYWNGLVSWQQMGPFVANGCQTQSSATCDSLFSTAQTQIGYIDQELKKKKKTRYPLQPNLDPDCLYQDFCSGNGTLSVVNHIPVNCQASGDLTTNYLRRKDVHKALHTSGPFGLYTENWSICSSKIAYASSGKNMVPLYQNFPNQKPGFRVLSYSGLVDIATVPHSTTSACLHQVSKTIVTPWQPWFVNQQTAGYWEQTPYFTHAVIKGSGHEAPQYQPLAALNMFERFVSQGNLTDMSQPNLAGRRAMPPAPRSQSEQLRMMLKKNKLYL